MSDPFDLLGVEPTFELDLKGLERRHRELSRALHPDRYAGRPPAERRQALGKAIEVNDAWRALKDPVRRAESLLTRLGLATGEGTQPPTDPELLMQLMELREGLGEARHERDPKALEQLTAEVRALMTGLEARFAEQLRAELGRTDGAPVSDEVSARLIAELGELRYYRKFLDDAAVIEDELF